MIDLRVRWMEGAFEQEVTRTTFAADPAVVAAAMAPLAAQAAEEAGEGDADSDKNAKAPRGEPAEGETGLPGTVPGTEAGLDD
jgi:hypothetical protein